MWSMTPHKGGEKVTMKDFWYQLGKCEYKIKY